MSDNEFEGDDLEDSLDDKEVVYQINTFGADFTVDGLVKRFDRGDIFRPKFQRNYVWTQKQASKFVESILLGLPIPSVFLYREESTQKHLIVDGLQRLTTLHAFHEGIFEHNEKVFRLTDVRKKFLGKTLKELDGEDQRRFEDSVIHAMVIQQIAPDQDNSSVFHIFERLNSYGTPLQPQEMRTAIYHGPFQVLLASINENSHWREIFGPLHKRGRDQELILRFIALYFARRHYSKPMTSFLNKFMGRYRSIDQIKSGEFSKIFSDTIGRAYEAFGSKAFRIQRTMNVSVFDSFMVAIASRPEATKRELISAFHQLVQNSDYIKSTTDGTSDEATVEKRITLAMDALDAAATNSK